MSINDEKLWAFGPWRYTESEKRFLYLIATQSGYFFHKHYAEFLGIAPNKRTAALIEKALWYGHVMQREYEQLSYGEIADLLRLPVNTVRSRLFRSRLALKQRLEPASRLDIEA